jgi:hypothetical protein
VWLLDIVTQEVRDDSTMQRWQPPARPVCALEASDYSPARQPSHGRADRRGRVAAGKIINLHIPQLYSIVRGKVGKAVEFGLSWGITRLGGGFILATMARDRTDLHDSSFAVRAVEDLAALFGKAPRAYAYDRAGHSADNVARLRKLGVREVGLAPRGHTAWAVKGRVKEQLIRERALVEGSIGTIKCQKYGFNRPAARSAAMMGVCGQRAVLGFNLSKLVRCIARKQRLALAG